MKKKSQASIHDECRLSKNNFLENLTCKGTHSATSQTTISQLAHKTVPGKQKNISHSVFM